MAGVQFEQLAGQIAAGQNPMRALGVQAADLGFVLGVPLAGAMVGIGAALASVLIPMLNGAKKSTQELEESINSISNLMSESATGSALMLSDSFLKLAKSSRDLAELQLRVSLFDAINNVTSAQKILIDNTDKLRFVQNEGGRGALKYGREIRSTQQRLDDFSESLGISATQALKLQATVDDLRNGVEGSSEAVVDLVNNLFATGETTEKFKKLAGPILETALTLKTAQEQSKFLKDALSDLDSALSDSEQSSSSFAQTTEGTIAALQRQLDIVGKGRIEVLLEEQAKKGATAQQLKEIKAISRAIEAKKAEIAETNRLAAAKKLEEEATKRAAKARVDAANRAAASVARGLLTEEELIGLSYQKRATDILSATKISETMKRELIERLTIETNGRLLELNQGYWDQWLAQQEQAMLTFDDVATGAMNTFRNASGSAFESIVFDSATAGEAVRDFAETMGRSVINALGQMAAEWAAYYLVQSLLGKTAQTGASAAMTANAAATSAQAGLAAFASTAAIPIVGPALAPGAAAAAVAATSPFVAAITALSSSAIAGRALGGQVLGGESYIVGERGPELLTMGTSGRVTPNEFLRANDNNPAPMQAPQTELNVQVLNYGSSEISVERISANDVRIIAREVASQTVREQAPSVVASDINNPNGAVSNSLSSNLVAQRRR